MKAYIVLIVVITVAVYGVGQTNAADFTVDWNHKDNTGDAQWSKLFQKLKSASPACTFDVTNVPLKPDGSKRDSIKFTVSASGGSMVKIKAKQMLTHRTTTNTAFWVELVDNGLQTLLERQAKSPTSYVKQSEYLKLKSRGQMQKDTQTKEVSKEHNLLDLSYTLQPKATDRVELGLLGPYGSHAYKLSPSRFKGSDMVALTQSITVGLGMKESSLTDASSITADCVHTVHQKVYEPTGSEHNGLKVHKESTGQLEKAREISSHEMSLSVVLTSLRGESLYSKAGYIPSEMSPTSKQKFCNARHAIRTRSIKDLTKGCTKEAIEAAKHCDEAKTVGDCYQKLHKEYEGELRAYKESKGDKRSGGKQKQSAKEQTAKVLQSNTASKSTQTSKDARDAACMRLAAFADDFLDSGENNDSGCELEMILKKLHHSFENKKMIWSKSGGPKNLEEFCSSV